MNEYSLIIRTLSGGEHYQSLLSSIAAQTIKPKHVYVVIPHGYDPPEANLGYEEFVYTDKGMWQQRMYGMQYAAAQPGASKYQLVCDDDVEFDSDFAQKIMTLADKYRADSVIPILDQHVPRSFLSIIQSLGEIRVEGSASKYKISVLKSSGFQVNNDLPDNVNPTQSGPFQCFFVPGVFRVANEDGGGKMARRNALCAPG